MQKSFWLLTLLFLLVDPNATQGQAIKKVTVRHENSFSKETYSVLKTASDIKHGPYRKYAGGSVRKLVISGYYTNGQKDSLWTEYSCKKGRMLRTKGRYYNDQKIGVWEYYNFTGELEQKFDYTRHQLLFNKPNGLGLKVTFRTLDKGTALEVDPIYIGGFSTAYSSIRANIRYPTLLLRSHVAGTVRIAFTITPEGKTTNYRVAYSIAPSLDKEVLRVVQLLPATWIPASAAGKPVAAECELPVAFQSDGFQFD